jgi:hypothetical protein
MIDMTKIAPARIVHAFSNGVFAEKFAAAEV